MVTALVYFSFSFIVTYAIGWLTGQLNGKNGLKAMYAATLDNINLAVIAPVGAGLLCYLYCTITDSFSRLASEGTIAAEDRLAYDAFLRRIDALYNNRPVLWTALGLSVLINVFNYVNKDSSWLGINGGITGIYGRLFVVINFFLIALILYKCAITVFAMRLVFQFNINVQPLHPDRSGGLLPIGKLAIAVNYFVGLILLFFTLLITLDPFVKMNIAYIGIIVGFYAISPFLLFSSLQEMNRSSNPEAVDIKRADEIIKVNQLYRIVDEMPVWPFDVRSLIRLGSTLSIPLVPLILDFLANKFSDLSP